MMKTDQPQIYAGNNQRGQTNELEKGKVIKMFQNGENYEG